MTSRLNKVGYAFSSRLGEELEAKHRVAPVLQCSSGQPYSPTDTDRVPRQTGRLT